MSTLLHTVFANLSTRAEARVNAGRDLNTEGSDAVLTYGCDVELLAIEALKSSGDRFKLGRHMLDLLLRMRRMYGLQRSTSVQTLGILTEGAKATIYGMAQVNHEAFLRRHFRIMVPGHGSGMPDLLEALRVGVRLHQAVIETIARLGSRPTESETDDEAVAPLPQTPKGKRSLKTRDVDVTKRRRTTG